MTPKKPLDVDQLRREYEAGDSLQVIADRHEVSGPVVARRLRAAEVQLRPSGRGYHALDVGAMRREYEAGNSFRQIAKRHGVTYGTARNRVLGTGIEPRPRGASPKKQAAPGKHGNDS